MKAYMVVKIDGVDEYIAIPLLNEVYTRQDTAMKRAQQLTRESEKKRLTSIIERNPHYIVKPIIIK